MYDESMEGKSMHYLLLQRTEFNTDIMFGLETEVLQ